ncbi:MAG: phosphodiester glycosidase family protein [Halodesulfovibrio sp.]
MIMAGKHTHPDTCRKQKHLPSILGWCLLVFLLLGDMARANEPWTELEPGLDMATFSVSIPSASGDEFIQKDALTVLRIRPDKYEFVLLTSSEKGIQLTPAQWAEHNGLTAVINASMYLPDNRTSTGYLRNGDHINNGYVNKRFGSFFVASPMEGVADNATNSTRQNDSAATALQTNSTALPSPLPLAAILDRQADDWERLIKHYRIVVQNFRMINAAKLPLWPEDGDAFSIAAVAMDSEQDILFIHCRPPLTVRQLTDSLLELPLGIVRAMYVEGGPQASLHVRTGTMRKTWSGRHASDFWSGAQTEWMLPNVLGIRRR